MKMVKPTPKDIDAAGDAMSVLSDISSGYYPSRLGEDNAPTFFDEEDPEHLRRSTISSTARWIARQAGQAGSLAACATSSAGTSMRSWTRPTTAWACTQTYALGWSC